ncbi:MarR family transcriptional regulator [Klebsiella pneumoniae]
MKKNSGKQAVINYVGQHPSCSFQDIRRGTGLDSSVVNSSLWQMHRDGQVKREGECRSYRYTLIDTITVSAPSGATAGTATITVKTVDGEFVATHVVTVTA